MKTLLHWLNLPQSAFSTKPEIGLISSFFSLQWHPFKNRKLRLSFFLFWKHFFWFWFEINRYTYMRSWFALLRLHLMRWWIWQKPKPPLLYPPWFRHWERLVREWILQQCTTSCSRRAIKMKRVRRLRWDHLPHHFDYGYCLQIFCLENLLLFGPLPNQILIYRSLLGLK